MDFVVVSINGIVFSNGVSRNAFNSGLDRRIDASNYSRAVDLLGRSRDDA
jgi:hypothetical protein